ncbi:FadR/GntR family transcriptional regulator [Streptomyces sp. Amel2xB2]|uniref:FadR/GntR family transcriptional regulator n=1 Tax=Streptomyces sp. Amel2xB2 TaxID=1305829 RepID=UPI0021AC907B|nr:GntR family transcriptional regulator [Streptomyces sp. Amel2xB2]
MTADSEGTASIDVFAAPVVVRSAAAQVADKIVAAIQSGRIKRHERLPPERELAKQLQVSRPTLREAFAALELAGVLESHQGRGSVVVAAPSQVANWGIEVLPTQVFEARLAVEPHLAELAAAKRYPEDIAHLREAGADLDEEYERTGAYRSDLAVHRAIARAARNPVLADALESALKYTESSRWTDLRAQALAEPRAREGHVDEVRRVIEHIAAGEGAEAASVWRAHLTYYRDEMLDGLKKESDRKPAGTTGSAS